MEKSLKHTPYPYSKENIYIWNLTNTRLFVNDSTTFVRVRPSHLYQKNKQKKLYITDFNLYQKLFINPGTNLYQGTNPGTTVCTRPAQYKKKKFRKSNALSLEQGPIQEDVFFVILKKVPLLYPPDPNIEAAIRFWKILCGEVSPKTVLKTESERKFQGGSFYRKKKNFLKKLRIGLVA